MKGVLHAIGALMLILWLLSQVGAIDFYLCVGARGSCIAAPVSVRTAQKVT
ncbi:hypothetical protein [Ottowia sp. VDI28]|uniref:hypothetical protein n=1 Tax=Ottowia sp. VDI28 TaxID=3133968 RepID=UPI003C2B1B25